MEARMKIKLVKCRTEHCLLRAVMFGDGYCEVCALIRKLKPLSVKETVQRLRDGAAYDLTPKQIDSPTGKEVSKRQGVRQLAVLNSRSEPKHEIDDQEAKIFHVNHFQRAEISLEKRPRKKKLPGTVSTAIVKRDMRFMITVNLKEGSRVKSKKLCRERLCVKLAVPGFDGWCVACGRKHGITIRSNRLCKEFGCDKLARKSWQGYCIRHGRAHGILGLLHTPCSTPGCLKEARAGLKGYCIQCAKDNKIIVISSRKKCKVKGCDKKIAMGGKGYCRGCAIKHRVHIPKPLCKEPGCQKRPKPGFGGYCIKCGRSHGFNRVSSPVCKEPGCVKKAQTGYYGYCRTCGKKYGYYVSKAKTK